jgi:hypothetical protein
MVRHLEEQHSRDEKIATDNSTEIHIFCLIIPRSRHSWGSYLNHKLLGKGESSMYLSTPTKIKRATFLRIALILQITSGNLPKSAKHLAK